MPPPEAKDPRASASAVTPPKRAQAKRRKIDLKLR
jgi:hypothetical protein